MKHLVRSWTTREGFVLQEWNDTSSRYIRVTNFLNDGNGIDQFFRVDGRRIEDVVREFVRLNGWTNLRPCE